MKERSRAKNSTCLQCGKSFTRSDTLLRHQRSHNFTEERGEVHRVTSGTFRACNQCATARSRCSGEIPCGRCGLRNLECVYPEKKRKTGNPPGQDHQWQITQAKQPADHQFETVLTIGSTSSERLLQTSTDTPTVQQQPFLAPDPSSGVQPQQSPPSLLANPSFAHPALPESVANDFNAAAPTYGYPTFDDTINWIPVSAFPSPYDAELEQDFSFLLPSLENPSDPGGEYVFATGGGSDTGFFQTQFPDDVGIATGHSTRDPRPRPPTSLLTLAQSPTSSASNEQAPNNSTTSSTDGVEAKRKRRRSAIATESFVRPRTSTAAFSFPLTTADDELSSRSYCDSTCYTAMGEAYHQVCLVNFHPRPFESPTLPAIELLNTFASLYFKHFHPNLPLIHEPTFGHGTDWLVMLSVVTIGASFSQSRHAIDMQEALQEFLRRAIRLRFEVQSPGGLGLSYGQSSVLNVIGLTMAHRETLRCLAPQYHAALSRWCLESGFLQLPPGGKSNHQEDSWDHWIETESFRRVAYIAWLLDTSLGYMANARPLCNMDDARTPLPCNEEIWSAKSSEEWLEKSAGVLTTPSLCAALERLYSKKAADPQLSDLSQILLINALFQRTWEVGTHIKAPLSEWVPTGKARGFLNTPSKDSFWLPLYPLYANWRNSACDCLDMIQWQAASVVARSSGEEHDLMLHLHLARIVLLTPFQEIQDLLLSLIGRVEDDPKASFYVHDGSYQPRNRAKLPQIRKITWRWLKDDQYKARLAMVSAGNLFWHVRRYSSQSFYEPLAVYLASLVLWTYGSYKSAALARENKKEGGPSGPDADLSVVQPSRAERHVRSRHKSNPSKSTDEPPRADNQDDSTSDSGSSSEDQPEFIHLDRPNDEEMVAHFVRNGHNMSGYMSNVGDICQSPQKVLIEGAKLLRTRLSCWGVSREYYDVLMKLSELRKAT